MLIADKKDGVTEYRSSYTDNLSYAKLTLTANITSRDGVPYTYILAGERVGVSHYGDTLRCKQLVTRQLLEELADTECEYTDWAKEVLSRCEELTALCDKCGGRSFNYTFECNDREMTLNIEPCKNMNDIFPEIPYEAFLVNDNKIEIADNLLQLAEKITNYDWLCKEAIKEKKSLQAYYDEKVFPIRNIPYDQRTQEQQEIMGYYSDWHKDVYGVRPREDRDYCYNEHMRQRAEKFLERD